MYRDCALQMQFPRLQESVLYAGHFHLHHTDIEWTTILPEKSLSGCRKTWLFKTGAGFYWKCDSAAYLSKDIQCYMGNSLWRMPRSSFLQVPNSLTLSERWRASCRWRNKPMRLYLINPSNPLVSIVNVKESRWRRTSGVILGEFVFFNRVKGNSA